MQKKTINLLLILFLMISLLSSFFDIREDVHAVTSSDTVSNKIENGSFEDPVISGNYQQPTKDNVPYWDTTAYNTNGTNGMIEIFKRNTGTYIDKVSLEPTDGLQGAELNADEESTLFQIVNTIPNSAYLWGLDHRGRKGVDTMALVIGPEQEYAPSKNKGSGYNKSGNYQSDSYKYGKDQMMQMVQWLKDKDIISINNTDEVQKVTLYSKKFAENGEFQDNEDNTPFSLSYSETYSQEWSIWVMASGNEEWVSYGSNDEAEIVYNEYGNLDSQSIDSPYFYKVPSGQTRTVFGFVSVETAALRGSNKDITMGNLLDNINFEIYNCMSGSSTDHGSANMSNSGVSSSKEDNIDKDTPMNVYTSYGSSQDLVAKVSSEDADKVEFAGVYITKQIVDNNGKLNSEVQFLARDGNEVDESEALQISDWFLDSNSNGVKIYKSSSSDWLKHEDTKTDKISYIYPEKWVKSADSHGNIIYSYQLTDVTYAFDAHFVFLKCPTITYDTNGGKKYKVNMDDESSTNVYDFQPLLNGEEISYIDPYESHNPEGQNDNWKFNGWVVVDDDGVVKDENGNALILDGIHSIACNYRNAVSETSKQNFLIVNGTDTFDSSSPVTGDNGEILGKEWSTESPIVYDKSASGLTMIAQWSWKQSFIPQTKLDSDYIDSKAGGTVEVIDGEDSGNIDTDIGSKYCYGKTNDIISVRATPEEGYNFDGWYDENGHIITKSQELDITQYKEEVKTYYARFSSKYLQTFVRQIRNGEGQWIDTEDDSIATLTSYEDHGSLGQMAVSNAIESENYKLIGWYDSEGNKVDDSMTNGNVLSYYIEGNATYYARFEPSCIVYFIAQTENSSGVYVNSTVGGVVTEESVKYIGEGQISSEAISKETYDFIGWFDEDGNKITEGVSGKTITLNATSENDKKIYYARFKRHIYTVKFIPYTRDTDGNFIENGEGGTVSPTLITGVNGTAVSSTATITEGYRFVGWYTSYNNMTGNKSANTSLTYSTRINKANATYYALFEMNSITLTKKIKAEDVYKDHGDSIFIFKLEGTDINGNSHTYYKSVNLTGREADEEGYLQANVTFENLITGTYYSSELDVSRYKLDSIDNVVNGISHGDSVEHDLISQSSSSAVYINRKIEWSDYSHNDIKINTINK